MVSSENLVEVETRLTAARSRNFLESELKWTKITEQFESKYLDYIDQVFDIIQSGKAKIRIMFTQNSFMPDNYRRDESGDTYFKLYYQFIKHAFGLIYHPPCSTPIRIRLMMDQLPDTREGAKRFKAFLAGLGRLQQFQEAGILLDEDHIAEVDSKRHDPLQALDIILGAMNFRLNGMHEHIPDGAKVRGRRTRAKERVYKHINKRINEIYPHFNIGATTGIKSDRTNRWSHSYRHWRFIPYSQEKDIELDF